MAKKDQLIQSITGRSQNTGSSSGSSGGSSWSGGSSGGMTKKEQLLNSVDSWHASPNTASNVYSPAQWAAEQAARNQQWREEQAAAQAQQKVGLWKDTTIQSNDEREQLMAEYRRIQNSNSIPMVRRKNEIRNRLEELDRELGNQEMYYGTDRVSGALGGAVTGWLGQQGSFLGKSAEALSRLGERLGGNTSDYAGWATDELSAAQIGNENDAAKRAQQVAEAQAMATWGGSMQDRASGNVQKAKSGLGKVGQAAVDVGVNATQMLLDRATGLPMPALYTRAAGGAMHEAEQAGASLKQQLLYGNTIGAVEAGTEMLTGGLAKIYGKGTADGLIESAVRKMARSDVGRKALLVLSDMGGEAFEELLSGVVQPAVQTIYNGQTIGQSYRENFDASEVLYDALIGGLMGGFGAGMKGVTGDYSQAAQRMSYTDQAQEALQAQWGTDRAGRRAAQDYAEIIARGMTGEATRADLRKLETRPTAQSVMEQMVTRESGEAQSPVSNVLRQAFEASGIEVSDEDMRLLSDGYVPGTDVTSYVQAVRDGYRMGRSGNFTLEQAIQNSSAAAGVDPVQFRHAFELGQGTVSAEADTADVTTEEGRTKLTARLASLGPRAEAAAEVYEDGQDVASFASAMEKAVNLYAANGANLQEIYDAAKAGRSTDLIGRLTPKQIERAAALGAQVREENTQRAQSRAAEFQQIQEQAAQIRQESDAKLGEINAAIFQVQDHINAVQQDLNGTLEGLGAARAAQPDIDSTQEYKDAMGRVNQMREDLKSTRQILNQLQKERIRARQKSPGKRKKGTVSYEGGSIEGRKVKGVDRKNMTRQQKKAAALVESVADAIGLDFVLFDGEANVGGAYIQGGTVYINVNSSIKVGEVQKSIAGASLSHELTHYMQQYAPEEYQELKDYIINEVLKVSPDELTRLVENERRWHQSQGVLSYDQALDEVIANACQTMLYDSKAIRKLARENMTLAQKIADVIEEIAEKIKAAFDEVDINDAELFRGVRDIAAELDRVQELWDKGIEAATRNLDTAGTKKAATEGGEVQYQVAEREEILHLQDQIRENAWRFEGKPALATVSSEISFDESNIGEAVSWIAEKIGAPVTIQRKGFGQVTFTKKRINQGFNYMPGKKGSKGRNAIGQALTTACVAAPEIVMNGDQIGHHSDHKGTGIQTWTFAGPVEIDGERGIMAVVVRRTNQNYYKVHRILTPSGDIMVLDNNKAEVSGGGSPENRTLAQPKLSAKDSIADIEEAVKENNEPAIAESATQLQVWEGEEPKKVQYGFKLMNVDEDGLPHAMFIDAAKPYEFGKWYKADSPKMENLLHLEPGYAYLVDENDVADESSRRPVTKKGGAFRGLPGKGLINQATAEGKRWMVVDQYADGSKSIHNVGINGSGGVSTFALRPGIHAVDIPSMKHIGSKSEGATRIDTRRPNQRWFLIEYPVDQDYNQEAYAHETKDIREHLPERGWYSFQTNSGAEAKQHWFITGGMKIVGAVSEADVRKYARDRGFEEDLPWKMGKTYSEDDAIDLDEYIRTTKAMPTPSKEEMRQRIESERAQAIQAGGTSIEVDTETESANVQYSMYTWNESEYVQDRDRAAKELAEALGITQKKARDYIDSVNSVAKMIADNPARLDYEDTGRSPFVGNTEYGGSFDFTTLCKKRRLLTGTFSAIQRALPNTALTAQEILEIRKMMDDAGLEVSCGKCYVEGSRASMGTFTKEFLNLYKKYYPGKWVPNMAEMNTPDGIEWVRQTHPEVYEQYEYFWNHYGTLRPGDPNLFASQQKPKLYQMRSAYKNEISKHFRNDSSIAEKNRNGGMRMQSFSDFEIVHLIDAMQVIMDMSRVGLNGQAYTKVPDFAWALGRTGLKINLSIDAWSVDENGKLVFNNKEGMNFDEAMRIRDANSENVGTICCVYDDAQLLAALADDRIDFIIPFHRSQWKKSQYKAMGLPATTKDYTYQQNEKWLNPKEHTHEYRGRQVPDKCTNYMPNTYWDYSKSGKENAEEYLRMCARDGKRPKFYRFLDNNGDGSFSLKKDGSTDGYWKLLIDFKMYDNEGRGVPQRPVRPDFNMAEINRMLNTYEGGHNQFPVAQGIVDEFVERYKGRHPGQTQFQMLGEVEETDKLIAVHNVTPEKLNSALKLGGLPMPSLAVVKAKNGHSNYGPISLVFGKDSIDPRKSTKNKVYGGDAWTPTGVSIEYKLDPKKVTAIEQELYELAKDVAGGAFASRNAFATASITDNTTTVDEDRLVEKLARTDTAIAAFATERGLDVAPRYREKKYGRYSNSIFRDYINTIGKEKLNELHDRVVTEWEDLTAEDLEQIKDVLRANFRGKTNLDGVVMSESAIEKRASIIEKDNRAREFVASAWEMMQDGGKHKAELDLYATRDAITDQIDQKELAEWLREKIDGVYAEAGIYNGKDRYSYDGTRRTFKQTHVAVTLENIVKEMSRQQSIRGQGAHLSATGLQSLASQEFKNLSEVRKASGRLARASDGDYEAALDEVEEHIYGILDEIEEFNRSKKGWASLTDIQDAILGAAGAAKTETSIKNYFARSNVQINDEIAGALLELYQEAAALPTEYFEAKPQRAVGFNEVLAAIIPDNTSEKLRKSLAAAGVRTIEYRTDDEADRLVALNSVEGAQWQQYDLLDDDTQAEAAGRETAYSRLQSENAILSDALKALQKVTAKQENTIGKLQQRLKLTKTPEVRESDARKLAASLIREAGSKADRAEIAADLKAIGDYMLSGTVDENNLKARAREVARKVLSQAEETVAADSEQLQQIRNNLEGKKIYLDQSLLGELDQAGGFDAVKNRLFGRRVYLSRSEGDGRVSVDELYETLHADFGEAFFPEAGTRNGPANAGEELLIIADVLEASGGMTSNPYEAYMGEATEEMANRIVMDALNGIMQPVETDADRWKSRRDGLNQRVKELKAQQALSDKEAARLWETVYELSIALDKADSKYRTLQAEADYRTAQLREEGAARAAEVKARERERANKQIQGLKEYYQDMQKRAKERRDESAGTLKYRAQIKKKAANLYEMLMKNDDKKHVPEVLKKPVAEFLESLNFTSKRQLGGGEETNADKEFAVRLRALERALSGQQDYIDGNGDVQEDLGGYVDISQENLQYLRDCISMIDEAMRDNREFTINQMSAAQLKQLSNFISNLNTAIRNLNSFMANARFESVREAAAQDIETMKKLGKPGKFAGGAVDRFAAWENGTPYYIMKRFGAGGKSIFDGFAKGWERMAFNAKEIIDYTEKLYSDKEVNSWKKDVHEITLSDGNKIQMTTAQIMELSMLLNREQARKHIEAGGIRIGDIENRHDVTHYHLSLEDIRNITGLLNARQVKVAKALQSFMARKGAEWGNEVSMRRFGYNFYTEGEEYYPIRTDANDRPMADTDAQMNSMFRLLNLSSSKSLNPRASNALVVGDIFDTFSDHMADMAKLNGMGLPILDAIKWFNYKERINYEDGTYDTVTMQAAMEQAYGPQAQKYFRTLMKDINGMTESGDRGVSLPGKLMSNYKIAAVGANLRVAFLQPTSYVRALTVIKPQFLVGVLPSMSAYREAMKWSGTAVWKSLGYYDTDISKSMRGQIQHADTIRDKIANASMVLAEKGDQLTWSRLWTACKRQAKAENHNLRGEALMQKTAELFREVVYSSQVMDSTLTRSEIMRGKTNWTKMMSAFMAEPTLSYNILLDAASEYSNDVRTHGKAGAWQRNAGKVGKAMAVYVCSAAFSAVVESLADAARNDDDDKYLDKVLEALLGEDNLLQGNLAQDLTILGKLPYIKNFISVLQGYSSGDMSTTAFNNLINVYKIWEETIKLNNGTLDKATKVTYYGRMTEWGKVYKTLQALSQLSGVAAANLTRDAVAIWNMTVGSVDADKKIKTYDSMSANVKAKWEENIKETGLSRSRYAQILTEANANGNSSVSQDEMNAYLTDAVATQTLTQEQADAIWSAQGWKKSWGEYQEKSSTKAEKKAEATPAPTGTRTEREVVNLETPAAGEEPAGATDYDSFMKQAPLYGKAKKEGAYNAKPAGMSLERYAEMLGAADVDGNGSLRQDELGYVLRDAVMNGEISFDEAARVWASQGWSHDLGWWAAKHP